MTIGVITYYAGQSREINKHLRTVEEIQRERTKTIQRRTKLTRVAFTVFVISMLCAIAVIVLFIQIAAADSKNLKASLDYNGW